MTAKETKHSDAFTQWIQSSSENATDYELAELIAAELSPVNPPPALRARVVSSIATTGRFAAFSTQIAEALDLPLDEALEALNQLSSASIDSWRPAVIPNVFLRDVVGGPRVQSAITGFLRISAGAGIPTHRHMGKETMVVLQGTYKDETDGTEVKAGEVVRSESGSEHSFRALEGPDLIVLLVAFEGIAVGDYVLRPGDPGL